MSWETFWVRKDENNQVIKKWKSLETHIRNWVKFGGNQLAPSRSYEDSGLVKIEKSNLWCQENTEENHGNFHTSTLRHYWKSRLTDFIPDLSNISTFFLPLCSTINLAINYCLQEIFGYFWFSLSSLFTLFTSELSAQFILFSLIPLLLL